MSEPKYRVTVYPYRSGVAHGNIMWPKRHPMRAGKFPPDHPVGGGFGDECGDGDNIKRFRALGYWASCFPEGDGITWRPKLDQSDAQCLSDILEAFSWDARWATGHQQP